MARINALESFHPLNVGMSDLPLPLPQSPEFAAALQAMNLPVRIRTARCGPDEVLRWQAQSRRFGPLGQVELISRGPVARDPDCLVSWLKRFHTRPPGRPLLLNAETLGADQLRAAGFWPLMTPASVAMLALGPAPEMRARLHQKWRNRLNRAEAEGLRISRHALDARHWLLTEELRQARQKGYRSLPPALSLAFSQANPNKAVIWEARHRGAPVAAVLMLRHGRMATWQIGHATPEGRRLNAMNLTLWTAMRWLSEAGHDCLDLGTLNTQDAAGLARFKLGTGAALHRLSGSWLHLGCLAPLARRLPRKMAA